MIFDFSHRRISILTAAVTAVCTLVFQGAPDVHAQGMDLHDVSASIVDITTLTAAGNRHSCGFVVGAEGLIATNYSHLNGVENVTVRFTDGTTYNQVLFHAVDVSRDLVVLQVPATGLEPVTIGDSTSIHTGDSIQTTCCGSDPMCANQWAEVTEVEVLDLGVKIMRFGNPPVPWMSGAPILNRSGQVVGIANILLADQSKIALISNDITGVLQNPLSPPVTLAQYIEYVNSQAAGDAADGAASPSQQASPNNPQHETWSMAGSWRVPNRDFIYMFVEDQGQLKGKEVFVTGGSNESFFILDKVSDTQYKGIQHFLWGCAVKKGAFSKWKSKTCHVQWETMLEQLGPDYAVIEYEGFVDGLPEPGDKVFKRVCETCGSELPTEKIRYEITRAQ